MTVLSPIFDEVSNPWSAAERLDSQRPARSPRSIFLGRGGWPLSIMLAVVVHAAIALVGLFFHTPRAVQASQPIALAYGWAAEFEGSGASGTITFSPESLALLSIPSMDAVDRAAVPKDLLAPPPGEIELVPDSAPVQLDGNWGTAGESPAFGRSTDDAPPAVNFRASPFAGQSGVGTGSASSDAGNSSSQTASSNSAGSSGKANSGDGSGDGGGKIGVPTGSISSRGMPIQYPQVAEERKITGSVTVVFDVTAEGAVTNVRVASSSGERILDRAARDGVQRWSAPNELWGKAGLSVRIVFGHFLNQ